MSRRSASPTLLRRAAALAFALAACVDEAGPTARFELPGDGDDFYALPYPSDLHRRDGHLDLAALPVGSLIVGQYRDAAAALDGFGLNAAMYARFDAALDPASLPDPAGSLALDASVYVVDVDPASPERGQRTPVVAHFRAEARGTMGPFSLAVRPYPGFPLREGTTYALVVTRRVRGAGGQAVRPSATFAALRDGGGGPALAAARPAYAPLWAWLDEPGGDERADVVSAAVFTTQHATRAAAAVRDAVAAAPAPVARDLFTSAPGPGYLIFEGSYDAPNFQTGEPPYAAGGGEIVLGADGAAIAQRQETMRFAITVPDGAMPAAGWPLVIYQHGTGGSYVSFLQDGTGARLAAEGLATISTNQVLHGPRNPGGDPEVAFYNFANPLAARDNVLQGAADAFSLRRLALGLDPAALGAPLKIDPTRVYFFGHSQGGQTGPAFVALEPSVGGAVFSGTGGVLYLALLLKTKPLDIPALVSTFLRDEPVDEDNPSLALIQTWMERADGVNYAPLLVRRPATDAAGAPLAPRSVLQTEGFTDTYSPNAGIEAFATALGGDLVQLPGARPVPGLALRGRGTLAPPFAGNLGGATAALAQFAQAPGSDGHFVAFDVAAAQRLTAGFLGTLARTGTATVVAP